MREERCRCCCGGRKAREERSIALARLFTTGPAGCSDKRPRQERKNAKTPSGLFKDLVKACRHVPCFCVSRQHVIHSPSITVYMYTTFTAIAPSRSLPTLSRGSPDISNRASSQEQGPRKAVRHARNMNEHGPVGISVATGQGGGLLEPTERGELSLSFGAVGPRM